MRETLDGINKVRFNDYTMYDPNKCRNGGQYGFWEDYDRTEEGTFECSRHTTADMEYCPVCGSFNDHYEGQDCDWESGYSCGEFVVVTEKELLDLINDFVETEEKYIEFL